MSASYGSALPSMGAYGINPYTMHQEQQQHRSSYSAQQNTSAQPLQPQQQLPYYPPLSALVEAQQPHHQPGSSSSLSPHYYFGHRHFNYTAPHPSYAAPASSLYDLEWTAPSPSSRTPTAVSSSSPSTLSPPSSSEQTAAATPGSATASSPYSRSLGSWDAGALGGTLGSSTDAAAISPVLLYHSPLLGASESDCEVAAAAAAAASVAGQSSNSNHHVVKHPYHFHYGLPASHSHSHHATQQTHALYSHEQGQQAAPSLDMSRRRGRKRKCDEAIMALHPSALMTVKEEDNDDGLGAAGLVWPFAEQGQRSPNPAVGAAPASSASAHGNVKTEKSGSETDDDECDDDFFSDDTEEYDEDECDDDDDDDDAVGRRKGASARRKRRVVKVERKVQKVQVTEDLNIEAHLSPESDGYRWRKYGRKTVKGSPYPRSYFKCTYPHCMVKKQVEAVIKDGHIVSTSSIYKGKHSHDRPCVTQLTAHDQDSFRNAVITGFSKYAHAAGANSPNNTPRLVVTTESNVDYLDDGYRWRKYGQKYVKGSGYPRSYYKCTDKQCPVKKQVDSLLSGMVVTYEGAHTHGPSLDKSSPRKRRRRTPSAPVPPRTTRRPTAAAAAAAAAADDDAPNVVKLESEDGGVATDADDLRSSDDAELSALLPVKEDESPHFLTYGTPHYGTIYAPTAAHQHHHGHQNNNNNYHQHHQPSSYAQGVPAYHGPAFFPLEMKKEKLDDDDCHQQHHYQQHHRQLLLRGSAGSEELCSHISGGFDDLHGEMIDFLMWEENGQGPRYGHPLPLHHNHQGGHFPQPLAVHSHYPSSSSSSSSSSSYYTPSLSSPLSTPSSSTSSFSSTPAPLDYDYPLLGSSFCA